MLETTKLKPKDRPDLGAFDWADPLLLSAQLSEEERMLRDGAHAFARDKLQPRVVAAFEEERVEPEIFKEMGDAGLLGRHCPKSMAD